MNDALIYLSNAKKSKGYTYTDLARKTGISKNSIVMYFSNQDSLMNMSYKYCTTIFNMLDIDIEWFYSNYFCYKYKLNEDINRWKELNPVDYSFRSQKEKIKNRIFKLESRKNVNLESLNSIKLMYNAFFRDKKIMDTFKNENDLMSDEQYNTYVVPILYNLNRFNKAVPVGCMGIVMNHLYQSEYSLKDLSVLCDISYKPLLQYSNGKQEFEKMRIQTVLKICYILNIKLTELDD